MTFASFRSLACRLVFSLGLLAACASPQTAPETAEATPMIEVMLTPEGDHLLAEWSLPQPVTEFRFDEGGMSVPERAGEWTIDTGTYDFSGFILSRKDGAAFDTFALTVPPARAFYDRFYVPVVRIGEDGWAVHARAFASEEGDVRFRFAGLSPDDIVFADGEVLGTDTAVTATGSRMIYFGAASNVHRQIASVVAGSDVPDWLRRKLDTEINETTARLAARFGSTPDELPVLFVTYSSEGKGHSWKGGSLGRYITVHLRGMALDPADDDMLGQLKKLILHETAHTWLGQMYRSTENDAQSWLEEGTTDYIASRLWMEPEQLRNMAVTTLSECRSMLGDASLLETAKASRGRTPYVCGFLVQLMADAAARQQGSGDILDIWRAVFEAAEPDAEGRLSFDTEQFRTVAARFGGEAFTTRLARLEAGLSPEGWTDFVRGLSGLGIRTAIYGLDDVPPDDRALSRETMKALLLDQCNGGYSIYGERDHFYLDMGDRCPVPLNSNPKLVAVNGHDLIGASGSAYVAVRQACAAGEPLLFTRTDGTDLPPIACGDHLKGLPDVTGIDSLPDFAPL